MPFNQLLRIMQLTGVILLVFSLHLSAAAVSQQVSFTGKNVRVETALQAISGQTGYYVAYNQEALADAHLITVSVKKCSAYRFPRHHLWWATI